MTDQDVLLGQLDELGKSEGGVGVGVFCQAEFFVAMMTFTSDLPSREGLPVKFDINDENASKEATQEVLTILKSNDIDHTSPSNRPTRVVGFELYQETAYGKSWSQDLQKMVPTWTDAYHKVVRPALKELVEAKTFKGFGKKYWAHFSLTPDPSGRVEKEVDPETGEQRPVFVWFPTKIYPNEAAMIAEAEVATPESNDSSDGENLPEGYTADIWKTYKPQVIEKRDAISGAPPVKSAEIKKLAEEYGLTVDFIKSL